MDILVKVSGDLIHEEKFYDWLSSIINHPDGLFILCGGGSEITEAFKRKNIPYEFGPCGREIKSEEGRRLAWKILELQEQHVWHVLQKKGIKANILLPVLVTMESKIFHVNGDNYAIALYPNFDKIYIATLKGRTKSFPENLNKLEVVYL